MHTDLTKKLIVLKCTKNVVKNRLYVIRLYDLKTPLVTLAMRGQIQAPTAVLPCIRRVGI